jgi:hypothetical protein
LGALVARVTSAPHLTDAHRAALLGELSATQSGLNGLGRQIAGDAFPSPMELDAHQIVNAYHVYEFLGFQVNLIIAADDLQAVATGVGGILPSLQSAVKGAVSSSPNFPLQTAMSDLQSKLPDATTQLGGDPSQLASLSVSGFPTNRQVLTSARAALTTAARLLSSFPGDLNAIVLQLGGTPATTTTTSGP